jgi:hypothetical protein
MSIIDRLKKDKKNESVLDKLTKKKERKKEDIIAEKSEDIEVRELPASSATEKIVAPDDIGMEAIDMKSVREFRTEGMHEFELDSLSAGSTDNIKGEYKSRVMAMIDKGQIDAAIKLLEELKLKLSAEK